MFPSTSGLHPTCREFRLPKNGHRIDECEDAVGSDLNSCRFAVADGATESGGSGAWARLLVDSFVFFSVGPVLWSDWLPPLQRLWLVETDHHFGPAPRHWYLDAQLEQGAYSTFLGLVLEPDGWYAQAVGDSCLFQVRSGSLIERLPVQRSTDFGSTPWLVGSRSSSSGVPEREGWLRRGTWEAGDEFFLMTDALSEWFLAQAEGSAAPWQVLRALIEEGENALAAWVGRQREARQLRNDDVALIHIIL
jgi:Protein phosphatase 2C